MAKNYDNIKFRSNWAPTIADPKFVSFVPICAPAIPRPKKANAKPKQVYVPDESNKVDGPPDDAVFTILDRYNDYRSCIKEDGSCYNNCNQLIGFIDFDSYCAGSINDEFLGTINSDYQIIDCNDEVIGKLDPGRATIHNDSGSTIVSMDNTGTVKGNDHSYLGQFEGFTYHDMCTITLYMVFIDAGMIAAED
eukprot:TRINITY_DN1222_c0_g1_i1.p1 TRINITY_DN1222_c0_g1~~TRINITY_DN1222_c0_g1_i1.p1  ORF type:complete len:193 (-),score=64.76 TRINITY_DN1222_c0_g1_i1:45-623(-)